MNKTKLILKNLPNKFENMELYFQMNYGATTVSRFGRRRAIVEFADENLAISALHLLHQCKLQDRIISAEFLGNRSCEPKEEEELPTENDNIKIPEFVKSLYATSIEHGFEQPPPPHLKYYYPKIDRNILDSICIALLSVPKFYYQVLHLMNRMNLEPPFLPLTKPLVPPGERVNTGTQTDLQDEIWKLQSDESELESDDNTSVGRQRFVKKAKLNDGTELKKKAKRILNSCLTKKMTTIKQRPSNYNVNEVFEANKSLHSKQKISLNVSAVKLAEKSEIKEFESDVQYQEITLKNEVDTGSNVRCEGLNSNKFDENQLKLLPIYKNYQRGERSNKLYIKNLSKDVDESDLGQIYDQYVSETDKTIEIKLMRFGKMKGQAFIIFNGVNNDDSEQLNIVEKALDETNGYILKNKPMIVCFGKRS